MHDFYQKTFFVKKKFIFKENGIEIELKDSDGEFSLFIHFDRIMPRENIRVFSTQKKRVLRIGLVIAGLTFLRGITAVNKDQNIVYAVIAMALVIAGATYAYYYFTRVKYYAVALEDNKRFQVLYDTPSHSEVLDFINEVFERRKQYYRRQYFFIDYENDRKAELEKMKWLLSENVITENEFNVVVDEIDENIEK